ncbi:DM13 domain-containing protein [Pseudanabaenaceae cyanobacterium LEGE 13415]|nr:DM13 domain-containing protein [Pseudanabaenaceae cyanobacterium LEGE 13415]
MRLQLYAIASLLALLMFGCSSTPSTQSNSTTASPIVAANSSDIIATGSFVNGEHPTKGGVQIIKQNGKRFLQLDRQFETSTSGPDLVVVLHRSANVIGETKPPAYALQQGSYVILAPLKQFNGEQAYEIPADVNLSDYKSAAIWCRRFNATFGAATLKV